MASLPEEIRANVVQGRLDSEDEGLDGDMEGRPGVLELVEEALEQGVPPKDILLDGLTPGMEIVGKRFETGEFLIPDMLASAECVGAAMEKLEPHLRHADLPSKGTFVIATVEGDLHDIGKNIVATLLRGAGFDVKDLGTGVPAQRIVEAVREHKASFVGLSALLTTTMPRMKETVDLLSREGLRGEVRVFVGGAPTSTTFAEQIGADAYCRDAFDALDRLNGRSR
jgi:5-methyltetrahydrofolate--homocysteine methyltransferase